MDRQEAIKVIKDNWPEGRVMLKEALETLIPELNESEDEKIRKEILNVIHQLDDNTTICGRNYDFQKWITWLEKQVEPTDKGEISDGYHTFNELYYYRMLYNAAFFSLLPKEWVHKSKRHHTGEECFGGGWFIVMAQLPTGQISNHYELKDWDLFHVQEKEIADEWDGHSPQEAADRLHKYLLEKQDNQIDYNEELKKCKENPLYFYDKYVKIKIKEQNPTVKTEPKFKVGDWVTNNCAVWCIENIHNGLYDLKRQHGCPMKNLKSKTIDDKFHLWTIQDAKDGDVLVIESGRRNDECLFIFKDIACREVLEHCYYRTNDSTFSPTGSFIGYLDNIYHPATKEQRDLLFSKMKEAGYYWNYEKKELKKIEQEDDKKPTAWSDEDEEEFKWICVKLQEHHMSIEYTERVRKAMSWLESIKKRMKEE